MNTIVLAADSVTQLQGSYQIARREDRIDLVIDRFGPWRTRQRRPLLALLFRIPTFRRWPTTYRWEATLELTDQPSLRSLWLRQVKEHPSPSQHTRADTGLTPMSRHEQATAAAPASHDPVRRRRLGTELLAAAGVYLAGAATMSLVFALDSSPRLAGNLAEFEQGLALYRWSFVGASLLASALVTVLVLLMTAARMPVDSARR